MQHPFPQGGKRGKQITDPVAADIVFHKKFQHRLTVIADKHIGLMAVADVVEGLIHSPLNVLCF